MADTETPNTCAACNKTEGQSEKALLRCAGCHSTYYCNKDCQRAHWKDHKQACNHKPKPKSTSNRSPKKTIENVLGMGVKGMLDDKAEEMVFKLLVDSFRMRVEDEMNFRGDIHEDSALGSGNPAAGFRRYLKKAGTRSGAMPEWWSEEKRKACVAFGCRRDHWWRLDSAVEKSDIQEQWGNGGMPMQLRMLGEEIVGSYVMGRGPGLP